MMELSRRMAIVGLVGCLSFSVGHAGAQEAASGAPTESEGSGTACVISGEAYVTKDTTMYDQASAGNAIAKFTGAKGPLKATRFPRDVAQGRVLVNVGSDFRINGFTDPRAITVFGSRDVAAVPGHLWISAASPLKFVGAMTGKVQVELPATAGLARPIRAWTTCDALTFTEGTRPLYETPRNARGYIAKQGTLDLYGSAKGDIVHTLHISGEGSGLLLWGTTVRGGFVHVTMRSNIYLDAWVRLRDVRALPRGELMDQVIPPTRVQSAPQLALKEYLREMRSPKQVYLHFGRGIATPIIGTIEPNAEIYVLETILGWATVLPKGLQVLPHGDRAFWVNAEDLGMGAKPDAGP